MRDRGRKIVSAMKELAPSVIFLFSFGLFFCSLINSLWLGAIIGVLTMILVAAIGEGIVQFETIERIEDEM